jgi:hypothetical protein
MSDLNHGILMRAAIACSFAIALASCGILPKDDDADSGARNQKQVTCESENQSRNTCEADLRGYRLVNVREISDADCDIGRNFGYNNNGVWVDKGCRAEFIFNRIGRRSY